MTMKRMKKLEGLVEEGEEQEQLVVGFRLNDCQVRMRKPKCLRWQLWLE